MIFLLSVSSFESKYFSARFWNALNIFLFKEEFRLESLHKAWRKFMTLDEGETKAQVGGAIDLQNAEI